MSDDARRIIDLYDRNAAAWDAARQSGRPPAEADWLERFLEMAPPGGRLLDLGCGSGVPIARDLIASGRAVTGVDASPRLIALCRARFSEAEWIVADMRELALGERFSGILAWHSLFHLTPDDQTRIFRIFAAHAAPGAALLFTSGTRHAETIGCWQGEPLYHASLAPAAYEALLAESGFSVVAHVEEDPDCGGATVWLAKAAGKTGHL